MKCTLLIDGNWLLMSRAFVMSKYFNIENLPQAKEEGRIKLEELLANSINKTINIFDKWVDNIVLVSDGGSWRKQLEKPSLMQKIKYKGNRIKEKTLDWDYIFQALKNVCDQCKKLNITTTTYPNIEGDDWCWYWSRRLNDEGINTIIWSSDNDLKQLIQVKNGVFTCWWNDKNGIFFPKELDDKIEDEVEFFLHSDNTNPLTEGLKRAAGRDHVSFIDPSSIVMEKIICGDSGDNIKPLLQIVKGTKHYGVTLKEWAKIKSKLNISDLKSFFSSRDQIIKEVLSLSKFKGIDVKIAEIQEMFEYNKKLVWLNEKVIPESIVTAMNTFPYKNYDLSYIRHNYKVLVPEDEEEVKSIENLFDAINF